jgi:hypothetical protein
MTQKSYNLVTGVLFIVIGSLHLLRSIVGWDAVVGGVEIPLWISWVVVVLAAYLAYYGIKACKS